MRQGSTRSLSAANPGEIRMRYTNQWSAFDRGPSPQEIPWLGRARARCASISAELAHRAGLPTHFITMTSDCSLIVREYEITDESGEELPLLSGKSHGTMIPLEWIYRVEVDGSLFDRLISGEAPRARYGIPDDAEIVRGMKLPKMEIECTTKREAVDRHLSDEEAKDIGGLSEAKWQEARLLVSRLANLTNESYRKVGFRVPDGKFELGVEGITNRIVALDTWGTQDENRIIEIRTGDLFSKDIIRNYLRELPFYAELQEAKKEYPNEKDKWPEYPRLPAELVDLVSNRYLLVANRYESLL